MAIPQKNHSPRAAQMNSIDSDRTTGRAPEFTHELFSQRQAAFRAEYIEKCFVELEKIKGEKIDRVADADNFLMMETIDIVILHGKLVRNNNQ